MTNWRVYGAGGRIRTAIVTAEGRDLQSRATPPSLPPRQRANEVHQYRRKSRKTRVADILFYLTVAPLCQIGIAGLMGGDERHAALASIPFPRFFFDLAPEKSAPK